MKVKSYCRGCLKNLARQVVDLSGGDGRLLNSGIALIDDLFGPRVNPTEISNPLLRLVRNETGVLDPYADRKAGEFRLAMKATEELKDFFPGDIEGALMSSAVGNGGDFFVDNTYDVDRFSFSANVAKIAEAVYSGSKVLMLGDNMGDFVFDLRLLRFLKDAGKKVFYAIKERPVQNDMSMDDVRRFAMRDLCAEIISTGTDEVGIRKEEMSGLVKEFWDDGSVVIAKGMGNYETISEFDRDRPVIYIMKVKCPTVAEALGHNVNDYIAIIGGDHG